jgi:hypothetical protein
VTEQVTLLVGVGDINESYLKVKRDRMGHILPNNTELEQAARARQRILETPKGHLA